MIYKLKFFMSVQINCTNYTNIKKSNSTFGISNTFFVKYDADFIAVCVPKLYN